MKLRLLTSLKTFNNQFTTSQDVLGNLLVEKSPNDVTMSSQWTLMWFHHTIIVIAYDDDENTMALRFRIGLKQVRMYYRIDHELWGRCCTGTEYIRVVVWIPQMAALFLHEIMTWLRRRLENVTSYNKIVPSPRPHQSKNDSAKFHPDPILNDGATTCCLLIHSFR